MFPTIPTAVITQTFGNKSTMYKSGVHDGIDFGIPVGTPVYACMNGLVEIATVLDGGYGRYIVIKHGDGALSYYAHLSKIMVTVGQPVTEGQQIGLSGGDPNDRINGDGFSTGPHLHWEIRMGGKPVDPNEYCLSKMSPAGTATCIATIGLNVRVAPKDNAQILYTLKQTEVVRIFEQVNGWTRLFSLRPEWCYSAYLINNAVKKPVVELTMQEKIERLWLAHPELH